MTGWDELRERIKSDASFAEALQKCKSSDEIRKCAETAGISLQEEDIQAMTDLGPEELHVVSGGRLSDGPVRMVILVSGGKVPNPGQ